MVKKVQLHIASRIVLCRNALGLSQKELASAAGLSTTEIMQIEGGESRVSAKALLRIAAALKITPVALFTDIGRDPGQIGKPSQGFAEAAGGFAEPEEIVRLVAAFDAIAEGENRLSVIVFAEEIAKSSLN